MQNLELNMTSLSMDEIEMIDGGGWIANVLQAGFIAGTGTIGLGIGAAVGGAVGNAPGAAVGGAVGGAAGSAAGTWIWNKLF